MPSLGEQTKASRRPGAIYSPFHCRLALMHRRRKSGVSSRFRSYVNLLSMAQGTGQFTFSTHRLPSMASAWPQVSRSRNATSCRWEVDLKEFSVPPPCMELPLACCAHANLHCCRIGTTDSHHTISCAGQYNASTCIGAPFDIICGARCGRTDRADLQLC